MKVTNNQVNNQVNIGKAPVTGSGGKNTGDVTGSSGDRASALGDSAKVNFSEHAQKIARVKELATPDMDEIREDKVAHLQRLIDEGKYDVSADAIADRLVDEHLIS